PDDDPRPDRHRPAAPALSRLRRSDVAAADRPRLHAAAFRCAERLWRLRRPSIPPDGQRAVDRRYGPGPFAVRRRRALFEPREHSPLARRWFYLDAGRLDAAG